MEALVFGFFGSLNFSEVSQSPVGVAELLERNTHPVHQRQIETARPAVVVPAVAIVENAAGLQAAAAAAGEQNRHFVGLMPVAVEQVRAEHEQRAVEERAASFIDRLQSAKQIGELLDVELVGLEIHGLAI